MYKLMSFLSVFIFCFFYLGLISAHDNSTLGTQDNLVVNTTKEVMETMDVEVNQTEPLTTTSEVFNLTSTNPYEERTLILLKPEVTHRGLIGTLIARIEQKGFRIAAMKFLIASREQIEAHYADHAGKHFYESLVNRTSGQPIVAMVLEGLSAVSEFRRLMGSTDPKKSPIGTLRAEFGMQSERNLLHASDSVENALLEISLWFAPHEVFSYERAIDNYIYYQ